MGSPLLLSRHDFALIPFQSRAFGALNFGEQEQPVPSEVSANATRPAPEGDNRVAKSFKLGPESPPRPRSIGSDGCGVFPQNKARAKLLNNADELTAETLLNRAGGSAGVAVVLARVAARDEVGDAVLVNELVGSDAGALSEFDSVDGANNFSIFVLRVTVADPAAERSHVIMPPHFGPMLRQHALTKLVNLHLADAPQARPFEAQVDAADAGE